ncbi:protein-L-isoaspartate O-methyltransferase [uncultured Methylobacterium sp.]|uniref:protein-L-isoaspartate O-methyltransferase family protein n=1 Tax=uncultured Methylobacterium sp. TaxID=157278 RepID=UPI0035CA260D
MTGPREGLAGHDGLGAAVENAAFVLALRGRGTRDTGVLRAMEQVPRARFAPPAHRHLARRDLALPLPCGAAMAAPSTVATMLTLLRVEAGMRVLEIGTGSGYVTALLLHLGADAVTGLERYATLAALATASLDGARAQVVQGDGLAEAGEGGFDRILVHGAVAMPPPHWAAALNPGGRLVAGSGTGLVVAARTAAGLRAEPGPPLRLARLVPGRASAL